jgi:hypothetical protein
MSSSGAIIGTTHFLQTGSRDLFESVVGVVRKHGAGELAYCLMTNHTQVDHDAELNIAVWGGEWADVINDARARLDFINSQLSCAADRESAKTYLKKTHAKFIPAQETEASSAETAL